MKEIKGSPKSLKQLLQNTKYTIHYYQREYMWQRKQVEELIDDLTSEFLESYSEGDERPDVQNYEAYFMGSIVLAGRVNAIIDGQQRFSTLTLLLIYLNNRLKKIGVENRKLREMIYSESYGDEGFNIKVEDRIECMNALYNEKPFNPENSIESVKNLYERYNDITEIFPEDKITEDMLLIFCDWLVEKVMFIEIETENDQDAHKIFVTMNDRGLNLTPTEMLKGYLLSEVEDDKTREKLNEMWKDKILKLKKDDKKGDETFIKDWLRAQYAETMRPKKKGAENKDFEMTAGQFHKWVRDERNKIGLNNSKDFELFLKKFDYYSDVYLKIKRAEKTFYKNTEYVYYNAKIDISFREQLLLASICYEDDLNTVNQKINLVARFYDLYILSRFSNHKRLGHDYVRDHAFKITKDIRRCSIDELKEKLNKHYIDLDYNPSEVIPRFHLTSVSKRYIKHMLARITGFIEDEIGVGSNYVTYMKKDDNPFEIEHIISNHYEWFRQEYNDQDDFNYWRNNIGALLLLRRSINGSLSDSKYPKKLKKYCSTDGNIYSESLGELAYQNKPKFVKFKNKHDLKFKAYEESFGKDEIEERIELIIQLVNLVWNNDMFVD